MRQILIGLILGVVLTLAALLVDSNLYEYHMHVAGDPSPPDMVNRYGWELRSSADNFLIYRRPKFHL